MSKRSELSTSLEKALKTTLVRNLKSTSHGRPMVIAKSFISKTSNVFESIDEKWAAESFEFDPNVECYISQPFSFNYENPNGRIVRYTPDLLVRYVGRTYKFIELKDERGASSAKTLKKHMEVTPIFEDIIGYPIEIFNRAEHQPKRTFANLQLLNRFQRLLLDETVTALIKSKVGKDGCSFAELTTIAEAYEQPVSYVMTLLAKQEFTFDMTEIVTPNTLLIAA
jgi:hypothetical protein